jgi:putative addiction module component (TIGR02574 family)
MGGFMDVAAVLKEVEAWPVEDRIRFVETLWNRLLESGFSPTLTDAQRSELDRRLDGLTANPGDVMTFEAIEGHVKRAG